MQRGGGLVPFRVTHSADGFRIKLVVGPLAVMLEGSVNNVWNFACQVFNIERNEEGDDAAASGRMQLINIFAS